MNIIFETDAFSCRLNFKSREMNYILGVFLLQMYCFRQIYVIFIKLLT